MPNLVLLVVSDKRQETGRRKSVFTVNFLLTVTTFRRNSPGNLRLIENAEKRLCTDYLKIPKATGVTSLGVVHINIGE